MTHPRLQTCPTPGCWMVVYRGQPCANGHGSNTPRPNTAARGYGAAWRKTRAAFLRAHPACIGVDGKHHPHCDGRATVADHSPITRAVLVARGISDPDAWHRLQPLSGACHRSKTNRYDGGWGNPKR